MSSIVLNAATQSPMVRTLARVPNKEGSFTVGVPDNIPPVQREVFPVNAATTGFQTLSSSTQNRIAVPETGHLDTIDLKFTVQFPQVAAESNMFAPGASMFAYELWDRVELTSHNRVIETLYSTEVVARIMRKGGDCLRREQDRARLIVDNALEEQVETSRGQAVLGVPDGERRTMYARLPFSCLESPDRNFDTRFCENLELKIHYRNPNEIINCKDDTANTGVNNVTDGSPISLSVAVEAQMAFRTFHDLTEANIRDANFVKDNATAILAMDTVRQIYNPPTSTENQWVIDLSSNVYCKELLIAVVREKADAPMVGGSADATVISKGLPGETGHKFYRYSGDSKIVPYLVSQESGDVLPCLNKIELLAQGRVLYEATLRENQIVHQRDFQLMTPDNHQPYTSGLTSTSTRNGFIRIKNCLSDSELYNSGGIALQSVNNPQLRLTFDSNVNSGTRTEKFDATAESFVSNGGASTISLNARKYQCHVFYRHYQMIRIDSNTGGVSRSMDV